MGKTAVFIPGFSAWDKLPYMYLPFLKRLKCFDDIYVLFDEFRGAKDDIRTISSHNADYIRNNIGLNDDIYLIGHSMGGLECLDLYTYYKDIQEKTKSITTICTPLYGCTKLTEPFAKKYKAVADMQPNSQYLKILHGNFKVQKEKDLPILNIQAGLDHLVRNKSSKLVNNQYTSKIKSAMHTNVLLYPRTAMEIYGFNTYKVMESNGLDIDPKVHFRSVVAYTVPAIV